MSANDPEPPESTLERIINERRGKAAALRAAGSHPFRNDIGPTTTLAAVRAKYEATKPATPPADKSGPHPIDGETLRVSGRVMIKRLAGKNLVFAPIRDTTGELQLFINAQQTSPEDFATVIPNLDAGDIVAAARDEGLLLLTAGENVVRLAPPLTVSADAGIRGRRGRPRRSSGSHP